MFIVFFSFEYLSKALTIDETETTLEEKCKAVFYYEKGNAWFRTESSSVSDPDPDPGSKKNVINSHKNQPKL